jgi:hypothetical protein
MKITIALISFLLFVSCATAPLTYNPDKVDGRWAGSAQIKDFRAKKTNTISFEAWAEKPTQLLRLEITGPMGFSLASVLLRQQNIAYAIHPQKKFFAGHISESSLRQILHVNLNPSLLFNVFFDEPVAGWNCQNDSVGSVAFCERTADHLKIKWQERKGELKRVLISNENYEVQILVKDFSPKVERPERTYSLVRPPSYRYYKLN